MLTSNIFEISRWKVGGHFRLRTTPTGGWGGRRKGINIKCLRGYIYKKKNKTMIKLKSKSSLEQSVLFTREASSQREIIT